MSLDGSIFSSIVNETIRKVGKNLSKKSCPRDQRRDNVGLPQSFRSFDMVILLRQEKEMVCLFQLVAFFTNGKKKVQSSALMKMLLHKLCKSFYNSTFEDLLSAHIKKSLPLIV